MVGMGAEVLRFEAATVPELTLQTGAPLIHSAGRLIPRRGHDEAAGGSARNRTSGRNRKRVRQAQGWQAARPQAGDDGCKWRIRVQEGVAICLVRIEVDACTAAKHGFLRQPIGKAEARSKVLVLRLDEARTRFSND